MKESDCSRAIMVAHNATFDHSFTMTAAERADLNATLSIRLLPSTPPR